MALTAIAGIFFVAIVCGVGFGAASADPSSEQAGVSTFGLVAATTSASASSQPAAGRDAGTPASSELESSYCEKSVLTSTSRRTLDAGLAMIDAREADRLAHAEEEHAAAIARVNAEKAKQGYVQTLEETGAPHNGDGASEYGLPAVDWSVGYDAFVEEWSARIDAYLSRTELAGYGKVFAQAAWENGVDPRWSPAISNTESGNGSKCFMPHNAWGWGESGWDDWETAIRAHVKGLSEVYGYCITPEAAAVYCPPNTAFWYSNTISQMSLI